MFPSFSIDERAELLKEAAEACALASEMTDAESIRDLLQYAAALELEAARLDVPDVGEKPKAHQSNVWDQRCAREPSRDAREPSRNYRPLRRAG